MIDKAELLKRQRIGASLVAKVKERLATALGRPANTVELATIAESEELSRLFNQRWEQAKDGERANRRFFLETAEASEIEALAATLQQAMGAESMYLFVPESPYCGAARLSSSELLSNLSRLATLDQDDVFACDVTGNKGVACEYFSDWGPDGSQTKYRLLAWC
jgi:hypothetical protein